MYSVTVPVLSIDGTVAPVLGGTVLVLEFCASAIAQKRPIDRMLRIVFIICSWFCQDRMTGAQPFTVAASRINRERETR